MIPENLDSVDFLVAFVKRKQDVNAYNDKHLM
jgi:hypothetical protein